MKVEWDRIFDFVFDTFGDDNAEMARYALIEFGINPDTRRPIVQETESLICPECGADDWAIDDDNETITCAMCGEQR